MKLINRIEASRFYVLGRILIPDAKRRAACLQRGEHHPQPVPKGEGWAFWCGHCGAS